jgi:hypothetical protein
MRRLKHLTPKYIHIKVNKNEAQIQTVSMFHQHYYITFMSTVLTKTYNILHYWYHNIRTPIVTYFIAVSFIETLMSAP